MVAAAACLTNTPRRQKTTLFSAKRPSLSFVRHRHMLLDVEKVIKTLRNVAQRLDCALSDVYRNPRIFHSTSDVLLCKTQSLRSSQPTWSLGQTLSRDDLVSESFISYSRRETRPCESDVLLGPFRRPRGRVPQCKQCCRDPVGGQSSEKNGGSQSFCNGVIKA